MVMTIRLITCFMIMLLFILTQARDIPQGKEETKVATQSYEDEGRVNNIPKKTDLGEEGTELKGNVKKTVVKVRRTAEDGHGKMEKKNSGAITSSPWKKEKLKVKICNHNVRIGSTTSSSSSSSSSPKKANNKVADFVALTADYKDPKSHPPRHN